VTLTLAVRVAASSLRRRDDGFTLTELLVVMAITLGLMAALFGVVQPAQGIFDAQPELADMQQRLRVGVDVLTHDLLMANAPVMPYRVGRRQSDPERGVFFRPDTISVLSAPWDGATVESHTYYLRRDPAAGEFQLRHYDGASTDRPVLDHVVQLKFEYFGAGQIGLDNARFEDGPWFPNATDSHRFDADLLNIRLVRVTLRVQAARAALRGPAGVLFVNGGTAISRERYLPDREIRFDVTPRNLDHE
jgi:prepilin-type N-terminal cleavage/methylation domain-containing protein